MCADEDGGEQKRVIVVGASVSGADTAVCLIDTAQTPIHAVVRGEYNGYFGDEAFRHPKIQLHPSISYISSVNGERAVFFEDGTHVENVDHIIFGTGYSWTLPFLPGIPIRNNRVPDLYLHIFHEQDPSLAFVGAVGTGFTFKVFEWQAVLAARVFAGKATLPSIEERRRWTKDRIAQRGDGPLFILINPDFEEYFELLREMAGSPTDGQPGRRLPTFDPEWVTTFNAGHQRRIQMWRRANEASRKALERDVKL